MYEIELQFDTMEENTDLAKEYITTHNGSFYPLGWKSSNEEFILDNANNKLYNTAEKHLTPFVLRETYQIDKNFSKIDRAVLEKLANRIEENSELFAQLESLIRKKRKEDVMNWDIQLIVQNFLYHSACSTTCSIPGKFLGIMNNTPLANLGYVVGKLLRYDRICIIAAQNTGVACHLFTKLCHEVGLTQVFLEFRNDLHVDEGSPRGCVGVITAQSDVDSAVDTLLSSSTQYPWKVQRILIQESIYETVRKIFQGKCDLESVDQKFKTSCTDAMAYGDKLVVFDDTANLGIKTEGEQKNVILVEAYRTTKEMISLVNKEQPFCISLWSSNVAEADEIAFSLNTQTVWINEYGSFWGPPNASQAMYSTRTNFFSLEMDSDVVTKLIKLQDSWKKTDLKTRKTLVKEVIDSCADHGDYKERVLKLIRKKTSEKEMFVEIRNNRMCIGESKLGDVLFHSENNIEEVITYLISGKAVMFSDQAVFKDWLEELANKGLPVIFKPRESDIQIYCCSGPILDTSTYPICGPITKVVYKNFGTIFAN